MSVPAVSVVMTAFRHAKYIEAAVSSCLDQTFQNLEVIVVDDGSIDGSLEILSDFRDPRLVVLTQANAGPSLAFNRGFRIARGEFVAVMSGDDQCLPERVERQLSRLVDGGGDAIFSLPMLIDEDGAELPDSREFFEAAAVQPASLLRALFFRGNFLCAPSAMIRRSILTSSGMFNPALYQLQDFDLWLRLLCARAKVLVTNDRVVRYRIRAGEANLSSNINGRRIAAENIWIYRKLFRELDGDVLQAAFAEDLALWGAAGASVEEMRALIFLLHDNPGVRACALEHLIERVNQSESQGGGAPFMGMDVRARDMADILRVMA